MYHPTRGGVRGGRDQFKWDDVKVDKHRENYLGHSIKAPVGRWQKGKDLFWYTKDKKSDSEDALKEEIRRVKEEEEHSMREALGLAPKRSSRPKGNRLDKHEYAELIKRGSTAEDLGAGHAEAAQVQGLGLYKSKRRREERGGEKERKRERHSEGKERRRDKHEKRSRHESDDRSKRHRKDKHKRRHDSDSDYVQVTRLDEGQTRAMNGNKQSLIYSFVAKGSVVLAEHTAFSGNFSTIAVQCLQKLPPNTSKSTYSCDGHTFNFLVDRGFVFLVVADEAVGRSVPFVFLDRVREDFMQRYGSSIDEEGQHPLADDADDDDFLLEDRFSIAYNLDREFGPRLKDHMLYCINHPEEISKLSKVKAHLTEVKGIMMDNIEKILERGEKIELLVGKTETLQSQADSFHRHGRELRRKMWLQNLRFKLMVGGAVAALILFLWLIICGGFKC
uniref:Uncharacterized protein n=1 Tax=Oryza meridionalis TaxID=40149 RepID=A0A0E0EP08_9ORYZ